LARTKGHLDLVCLAAIHGISIQQWHVQRCHSTCALILPHCLYTPVSPRKKCSFLAGPIRVSYVSSRIVCGWLRTKAPQDISETVALGAANGLGATDGSEERGGQGNGVEASPSGSWLDGFLPLVRLRLVLEDIKASEDYASWIAMKIDRWALRLLTLGYVVCVILIFVLA
jgi:hypothetical protein